MHFYISLYKHTSYIVCSAVLCVTAKHAVRERTARSASQALPQTLPCLRGREQITHCSHNKSHITN